MTNKELFVNAFIEAKKIEYTDYLDKSFFTFEFSPKFEKKMSKLVSKEHLIKFSTRRKISKSLIAAVVAIIVMFTGLMSVSATRRKAIDFIEKIFPKHITVEMILYRNMIICKPNIHFLLFRTDINLLNMTKVNIAFGLFGKMKMMMKSYFHKLLSAAVCRLIMNII